MNHPSNTIMKGRDPLQVGISHGSHRSIILLIVISVFNPYPGSPSRALRAQTARREPVGCTTLLVGQLATKDWGVLMGHNEDMGTQSGRLVYRPEARPEEKTVKLNYETLPQVERTFEYWASGNSQAVADRHYDGGWILCGMNEFGVSMGCNTVTTREERIPRGEGILRYSIRQLIMERAKSSREAVDLVASLIDAYGQSGSPVTYCLADREEAWVVETTYRHWVAKRVPDDGFHVVANQYTIETEWDLASDDLIEYAAGRGWHRTGKPFNFKAAYGDPEHLDRAEDTLREMLGRHYLESKVGSLSLEDLLDILSEPPIQTTGTQAFMVWHLRKDLPREIGCVMWHGMSGASTSVAVPVFVGSTRVPASYTDAAYEEDQNSAWWAFERLQRTAFPENGTFSPIFRRMRDRLDAFQEEVYRESDLLVTDALIRWEGGQPDEACAILDRYTHSRLEQAMILAVDVYHAAGLFEMAYDD